MSDFTGYNPADEDQDFIASLKGSDEIVQMMGSYQEVRLDPRKLIRVENQKSMGSCQGQALSTNLEWIYCIQTAGKTIQLSRMQAYIMSQDMNNIRSDSGSVVSSGVKLALEFGLAPESLWPYPQSYNRQKPSPWSEIEKQSEPHKIGRAIQIKSWDAWRTWLGSGQGGIHTGISWGNSMNKAIIETFSAGGGGHSVAALCLSERVDSAGDPYSFIANSWGESFGSREHPGWHEWSPTAIKQMLRHPHTTFVGLSDMPAVKPRPISLAELKEGLRI